MAERGPLAAVLDRADRARVDLWVRQPVPYGARERCDRICVLLKRLEAADHVGDLTVRRWGNSVPERSADALDDDTANASSAVARFREWARETDRSLEPAFRTVDDRVYTPVLCLAVYVGDDLEAVVPCTEADGACTVMDAIERLESGSRTPVAETG